MKRMSKRLVVVFAILFSFCFFINVNKVYAETNEFSASYSYSKDKAEKVLNILNQRRTEIGLSPLVWDYDLERMATIRAAEASSYFSHTRPNGESCFTVVDELEAKYKYSSNGENIAYGYYTADGVMDAWMNSAGHKANILNSNYNTVGIACTGTSWVQFFGTVVDSATINTTRYVGYENMAISQSMKVQDLYVEPIYPNAQMRVGSSKNIAICFSLRSMTIPSYRLALSNNIDMKLSIDNSQAITIYDNTYFTLNDYDTYNLTAQVGGKSASMNITGLKPDMSAYTFDAKYYANKYSDLKAEYGYDKTKLKVHWETFGINEGRQASPVFAPKYYLENNFDLKSAFGNNYKQALSHFSTYGASEGRKSAPEYWGNYYKEKYEDLSNFSACKLVMHYYSYGYNEGRTASNEIILKPVNQIPEQPKTPEIPTNNVWNGDVDKILFDADFYGTIHEDLRGMDSQTLYVHWTTYGINEGRQASIVFAPKYYLENNSDLKSAFGTNYKLALEHYKTYGIKEGRKSSIYFDGKFYLNSYSDLKDAFGGTNYSKATEHFVTFGMKEGRVGASTFNVNNYRNRYIDLNSAFGNNYIKYYNHYIAFGQREGRNGI